MQDAARNSARIFKTAWFATASNKARILDRELCAAIKQVMLGQCDDLGGGVFKKRLNRNLARAIIVAKGGRNWVYAYLFEKKDKSNIDRQDLANLRSFAELFARKTETEIALELSDGLLLEICRDTES